MRAILLPVLLAAIAPSLGAQVIRVPARSNQPAAWISLNAGYLDMNAVNDGGTATVWDFGTGLQYRASLEQAMQNNGALGLTATYARLPMLHRGDEACASASCDAQGDIWQLLATFRMGGGQGFHQVIDLSLGVTSFRNFTLDETGAAVAPLDGDNDFTLSVGYGFGYGFSPRTQIMLVQDFTTMMHQRDGLSGNSSNFVQQRTTRLGIRYGLGTRRRF